MDKKVEDFYEEVRKAIASIPKRPSFIMKEANVVGIKLNSYMLDKLTKDSYFAKEKDYNNVTLMGTKVYLDETVNRPKYIVEGEIMASFHPEVLMGNSIKSYAIDEAIYNVEPSGALKCLEKIDKKNYLTEREHKEFYSVVEQGLIKAEQYKALEKEFGCPLEVVFKALKNGIYTKESETDDKLERFEVRGIEKKGLKH